MPITSDPAQLAAAAKCFCYGDQKTMDSVIVYLLAQLAGDSSTPSELAVKAKCYCYTRSQRNALINYLLDQLT